MNFSETLAYIYGLQRFGIKLGLQNMQSLVERLPALQAPLVAAHVAGTNGKGSVSAFLAEILRHSGLRVGLYTSPHLHCFTERIAIDGRPISPDYAAALATRLRRASAGIPATFFEFTTAMALLAFQEQQVDAAVIETGLGGRLDATNVITPSVSLITPVSLDHHQQLGSSHGAIAAEKAGIIKSGIPVVIGRQSEEALGVLLECARQQSAPVIRIGKDYCFSGSHTRLNVTVGQQALTGLECHLPGEHQLANYAQAIAGACQLQAQGLSIASAAIRLAGKTVRWPGRLEWWNGGRQILLDAAHNQAGSAALAKYLAQEDLPKVDLLVGLSGDRSPAEVLGPLASRIATLRAVPLPEVAHVEPAEIERWAISQGVRAFSCPDAATGLFAYRTESPAHRRPLVVCGSLYLVAAIRDLLRRERLEPLEREASIA